ncbi:MAG: replication factor C large subunit [archaeon]
MSIDSKTWAEKYRARNFKEFKGQEDTIARLKHFIINFRKGKKAAILHGPSGIGKTTLVHALANDMGFEVVEMNASDLRNKDQITSVLEQAATQQSLVAKSKVLLIDEIDGISGYYDRGGVKAISDLISSSRFPIFMTCNDLWAKKLNELRQKADTIAVKEIDYKAITDVLKNIAAKENLVIKEEVLKAIAVKSKGDVRAAINDLQSISFNVGDINISEIHEREKDEGIFTALQKVFKTTKIDESLLSTFDSVDMPIDEIYLWVDENIPIEYKTREEIAKAYDVLSIADVFKGRIHRQQHWRFLIYQYALLTAGIAAAKKQARIGFTSYNRPKRVLKLWLAKQRNAKKRAIAVKIARATHTSIKRALKEFSYMQEFLKSEGVQHKLKLNEEEVEFLLRKDL